MHPSLEMSPTKLRLFFFWMHGIRLRCKQSVGNLLRSLTYYQQYEQNGSGKINRLFPASVVFVESKYVNSCRANVREQLLSLLCFIYWVFGRFLMELLICIFDWIKNRKEISLKLLELNFCELNWTAAYIFSIHGFGKQKVLKTFCTQIAW